MAEEYEHGPAVDLDIVDPEARRVYVDELLFKVGPHGQSITHRAILSLAKTPEPIEIWVSSLGGDVTVAFALYDLIRVIPNHVTTVYSGMVASAACVIAVAGDERLVMPNASMLWHHCTTELEGSPVQLLHDAAQVEEIAKRYAKIMARHSSKTARFWEKLYEDHQDHIFNAEEIVSLGCGDRILKPRRKKNA